MDITITPSTLSGTIRSIPSKSYAHRLLICASFADKETELLCKETNRDIEATADCLRALGADIQRTDDGYLVRPVTSVPESATLNCCESGSTLRFMLPIAGALGVNATFLMEGRLPERPISPLKEEMERMGCRISRQTACTIQCSGQLRCGEYTIDGGISSQFITGLLLACALLDGTSSIQILGKLESKPYVDMTLNAMSSFGLVTDKLHIAGGQKYRSPGKLTVEGDWSNAAFFLAANALGSTISVENLNTKSMQGDRAVAGLLPKLRQHVTVSAADIPDLIPILSVVAAAHKGAVFTNIRRLRIKESDRVASVTNMLEALGGQVQATEDTLTVYPSVLHGGTVDACGDHRIAMAAAIAATCTQGNVTILGAQCVSKSYPLFWEEYKKLGGSYEQHVR